MAMQYPECFLRPVFFFATCAWESRLLRTEKNANQKRIQMQLNELMRAKFQLMSYAFLNGIASLMVFDFKRLFGEPLMSLIPAC